MAELERDGVILELTTGNIVEQDEFDAVVNAANAQLRMGGGVAGAIHSAAGPALEEETRPLAPIRPGQAVITSGHNLPNPYVIHCLGPVYGRDEPGDELLASCYREALTRAEEEGLGAVAFPALSTGASVPHGGGGSGGPEDRPPVSPVGPGGLHDSVGSYPPIPYCQRPSSSILKASSTAAFSSRS